MKRVLDEVLEQYPIELFNVSAINSFLLYWEKLINNLPSDIIYLFAKYSKNIYGLIRVNKHFSNVLTAKKMTFLREWMSEKLGQEWQWAMKPMFEKTEPKLELNDIRHSRVRKLSRNYGVYVNVGKKYWVLENDGYAYYLDSNPCDTLYPSSSNIHATDPNHAACVYKYNGDIYMTRGTIVWQNSPRWFFQWDLTHAENTKTSFKEGNALWTGPIGKVPYGEGMIDGEPYRAIVTYEKIN